MKSLVRPLHLAAIGLMGVACDTQADRAAPSSAATVAQAATPSGVQPPAAAGEGSSPAPGTLAELKVGDPAPALTLSLHDGSQVALSSLKGQQVVVYFYPKDDTPGCTVEAQGIRDRWQEFADSGIRVFGVSMQDATSHQSFISKHQLPFPLVTAAEPVAAAFGVPVRGGEYAARHTFLIGSDGRIKAVWRNVTPATHASEILSAAKS